METICIKIVCIIAIVVGLWALINAASYCVCGELEWQTQNHCDQQFRVNYVGVVDTIRIFLPLLKSGKGITKATFISAIIFHIYLGGLLD